MLAVTDGSEITGYRCACGGWSTPSINSVRAAEMHGYHLKACGVNLESEGEFKIQDVLRIRLKPGDVLWFKLRSRPDPALMNRLSERFQEIWPHNQHLVTWPGADLEVTTIQQPVTVQPDVD